MEKPRIRVYHVHPGLFYMKECRAHNQPEEYKKCGDGILAYGKHLILLNPNYVCRNGHYLLTHKYNENTY